MVRLIPIIVLIIFFSISSFAECSVAPELSKWFAEAAIWVNLLIFVAEYLIGFIQDKVKLNYRIGFEYTKNGLRQKKDWENELNKWLVNLLPVLGSLFKRILPALAYSIYNYLRHKIKTEKNKNKKLQMELIIKKEQENQREEFKNTSDADYIDQFINRDSGEK